MGDLQQQVQQAIDKLVESGAERGLQVAVYRNGEQIVDAVAGLADPATGRAVTSATPIYVYSNGKAGTSAVVHILAERGLLDYDMRVAEVWPEFGAKGKEAVTIRQVLTHTAGVPGLPGHATVELLCDWDGICAAIADEELWWEPGTRTAYHAYPFGYILGEVVHRITGKPISQVLAEEVSGPLGIEDELYFGMPASEHGRLAVLEDMPGAAEMMAQMMEQLPADSPMRKAGPPETWPDAAYGNRTDVLEADIPAGGKMSARAGARLYAALLGEVDGVRLISPEKLREITAVAFTGTDLVFGNPVNWALGFSSGGLGSAADTPTVFGWGGVGGSFTFGDTATGTTFAFTKNRLTADFSAAEQLSDLVREATAGS